MKAYVIRTLLLCDWSFQQTATKARTQWKGMLLGCEQLFLWGGGVGARCVTSQNTAVEETMMSQRDAKNRTSTAHDRKACGEGSLQLFRRKHDGRCKTYFISLKSYLAFQTLAMAMLGK